MKTNYIIAALLSTAACLTPAYANTVLFTATTNVLPATGIYASPLTLGLNDGAGFISAYGYDNLFPSTSVNPPVFSGATEKSLKVQNDLSGIAGLGIANTNLGQDNGFVGPTDGIVLSFSGVNTTDGAGTISKVTFNVYEDYGGSADYVVYGVTGAYGTAGASYHLVTSGITANSTMLNLSTSSLYSSYIIGLTNDCALDIESVNVQYSGTASPTPEPGTFVMAGVALIGLGLTLKKRRGKV